ncbi:type I restriction enzyme, S subunit [Lachnospiraceae bacterium RM5]|nr:type I restriction enzyme, S subunit [Lachnospiraceae bacterium RM5]
MSWGTKRIEDICEKVTSGGTPKSTNMSFYNPKEVPWLKTGEVNYCRIYDTETYISYEGLARSSAKMIPEDSVIVAMYGQGDTAGRVAINKIPLCTNQACCNLIINKDIADYEYVYYLLSMLYEKLVSLKNGGAQPNLNAGIIKDIEIPLPDIEIQHKVAGILSAYDALIENNQKQIKLLEEAAQRLYKEWFVDLKFPGYEDCKVVDGVPEGWKKKRADDFFEITIGKTPPRSEKQWFVSENKGIKWISISDMGKAGVYICNTNESLTEEAVDKHNVKVVPNGTVLVSFKLTVGRVSITTEDMCTNEAIAHFYIKDDYLREYTYLYLKMFEYDTLGNTSSISKAVNSKIIKSMTFIMPDDETIKAFLKTVRPYFDLIYDRQQMILKAQEVRDRLLPKLMNEEIEVG